MWGGILLYYSAKSPCALPSCWAGLGWAEPAFPSAHGILSGSVPVQLPFQTLSKKTLVCGAPLRGGKPLPVALVFSGSHFRGQGMSPTTV